jgi:predicted anti-sigma-YlaC factor YlaD
MSSYGNGSHTRECASVREALSEYLEGGLAERKRITVAEHLASCAECRREERELSNLINCLNLHVPPREPSLDIWAELGPKVAAVMAEEKLSVPMRLKLRASRFLGSVAAGAILFTQALAMNTENRMHRYLTSDPFRLVAEED